MPACSSRLEAALTRWALKFDTPMASARPWSLTCVVMNQGGCWRLFASTFWYRPRLLETHRVHLSPNRT